MIRPVVQHCLKAAVVRRLPLARSYALPRPSIIPLTTSPAHISVWLLRCYDGVRHDFVRY